MTDSRYIIEITSPDFDGARYLSKLGKMPWMLGWSKHIWTSKFYVDEDKAIKDAKRAEQYVKHAFEQGWTTYGWKSSNDNPDINVPSTTCITATVIKVKLERQNDTTR